MYRNPTTDDPSVKGLSRGTANTQLFVHHKKLLVFKEDSPPVYMDPHTLETIDDYYTFGGKLKSQTHTAHPKIDSETGDYVSFGYEATGLCSKDIHVFSADRNGAGQLAVTVQAPYAGMMHDFAVTQKHVILTSPIWFPISAGLTPVGFISPMTASAPAISASCAGAVTARTSNGSPAPTISAPM